MLHFLPQELISLIVKFSIELESFSVIVKYKKLCKVIYKAISQDASLARYLGLSNVCLDDSSLQLFIKSLGFKNIRFISLVGNSQITHKSVAFLIRNTGSEIIDVQNCAKVDLLHLLQDIGNLEFSNLQLLKVLHSGQGRRYICRVSIGNLVEDDKNEILGVLVELESNLKKLNERFLLDPGICMECLEEMSIEFTPHCRNCKKRVKRSCGKCQSSNYTICIECLYTLCQECHLDSKDCFMFPTCSLDICYEHHGRLEMLRNLAVCGTKCKEFTRNCCYNCGFWVCPRTRECHYEMGVLRALNKLVHECEKCGHGLCELCKVSQSSKQRCFICKSSCTYCLEKGCECLSQECLFRICGACIGDRQDFLHPHIIKG